MPCYCDLISAYERDIEKLEEAYRINEKMDDTNDSLENEIQQIKGGECSAYEANNIEDIEAAVDKLDDALRPKRDSLGRVIMGKIIEAQKKKAEYEERDKEYHASEKRRRALELFNRGGE